MSEAVKKSFLQKFTVSDLLIIVAMATLGIVLKPIVVPIAHLVSGPLLIPGGALAGGLYMLWLVVGFGLVGKRGTATLIGLIQALVIMFTGVIGSHGIMTLASYVAPGLVMDLVLLVLGHRVCCRQCAVVAGLSANLTGTFVVNFIFFNLPGFFLVLMLCVAALSGAVGGLLAWELLRLLDKYHLRPQQRHKKKIPPEGFTQEGQFIDQKSEAVE